MVKRLAGIIACFLHGGHDWTLWAIDRPTHILIRATCNRCRLHRAP